MNRRKFLAGVAAAGVLSVTPEPVQALCRLVDAPKPLPEIIPWDKVIRVEYSFVLGRGRGGIVFCTPNDIKSAEDTIEDFESQYQGVSDGRIVHKSTTWIGKDGSIIKFESTIPAQSIREAMNV